MDILKELQDLKGRLNGFYWTPTEHQKEHIMEKVERIEEAVKKLIQGQEEEPPELDKYPHEMGHPLPHDNSGEISEATKQYLEHEEEFMAWRKKQRENKKED